MRLNEVIDLLALNPNLKFWSDSAGLNDVGLQQLERCFTQSLYTPLRLIVLNATDWQPSILHNSEELRREPEVCYNCEGVGFFARLYPSGHNEETCTTCWGSGIIE